MLFLLCLILIVLWHLGPYPEPSPSICHRLAPWYSTSWPLGMVDRSTQHHSGFISDEVPTYEMSHIIILCQIHVFYYHFTFYFNVVDLGALSYGSWYIVITFDFMCLLGVVAIMIYFGCPNEARCASRFSHFRFGTHILPIISHVVIRYSHESDACDIVCFLYFISFQLVTRIILNLIPRSNTTLN
jgi:hypothetical protein